MANFIGEHTCKLDSKGRVSFPAALKKQLGADIVRFVVKKDLFENCLVLYTMPEWEQQNQVIRNHINTFNKEHNHFLRGFYRGTAEVELDSSGRLLLPKRLCDIVGIDKDIVMLGQDSKIEIWANEAYGSINDNEMEFAALAEKIMSGNVNPV